MLDGWIVPFTMVTDEDDGNDVDDGITHERNTGTT